MGMGIHETAGFARNLLKAIVLSALTLVAMKSTATVDPQPSADCVVCDGSAVVVSALPGEVSYQWFDADGNLLLIDSNAFGSSSINNLCPGLFQVQLTNGTENELFWFAVGGNGVEPGIPTQTTICEETGQHDLNGFITGQAPGGTWTTPTGQPHSGVFDSSSEDGGLYTYTVDVGGCQLTTGIFVDLVENADPGLSATFLICETYEPFSLNDALAGTSDPGGQWYNDNQEPIDGMYYPDLYESSLFTYELDIVDGCPTVFSTLFVIENQLPDPGLDTEIQVCPNAIPFNMTDQMEGTPETDGTWYDENGNEVGPVFDPVLLGEGTYNYIVSGQTPCPSRNADLTITFTDEIDAGESTSVSVCEDQGNFNLFSNLAGQPTGGGVWLDPFGVETTSLIDLSIAESGAYTYQLNAVGCLPVESTLDLLIERLPNAGLGGVLNVCEDLSPVDPYTLLNNTDLDGQFSLDGNDLVGSLVVEANETYQLDYLVEGDICPNDIAQYQISVDQSPVLDAVPSAELCSTQGQVELIEYLNPLGGTTLEWLSPQGVESSGVLEPETAEEGLYTATLNSGNTCPDATAEINVIIDEPVFESGQVALDDCVAGQVYDLNTLLPEDVPLNGEWLFNGNAVQSVVDADVLLSGVYQYTIENEGGCEASMYEVELSLTEPLIAGNGNVVEVCSTDAIVNLESYLNGASGGGEWLFNGEPTSSANFNPSSDQPGVFSYTVPAQGPCPSDTADFTVEVQEGLVYSAGPDISVCEDEGTIVLGQTDCENCAYAWQGNGGLNATDVPLVEFDLPDVATSTTYDFQVTVSSGVCTVVDEVTVDVHPIPELNLSGPDQICAGEATIWSATGADSFVWSSEGEVLATSPQLETTFFNNSNILLTGVNSTGCTANIEQALEVLPLPDLAVTVAPQEACAPLTLSLPTQFPDQDATYWWEVDNQPIDGGTETVILDTPGSYDITLYATANNGCTVANTYSESAVVHGYPWASFSYDAASFSVLEPNVAFVNESQGAESFSWDFGGLGQSTEVNPTYVFPQVEGQAYQVCLDATSEEGCTSTQCESLFINDELLVYVPNAFTPDNDGVNDVFVPVLSGFSPVEYSFSVFNRWGEEVFTSSQPGEWWNGSANGGAYYVPDGVYIWVVEVRASFSAQKRRIEGHVTVLR